MTPGDDKNLERARDSHVTLPAPVAHSAILLAALAAAALVTLNCLSIRMTSSDPVLAAQLSPGNAEFAIAAAARLAGSNEGTRDPRVRQLVATALSRSLSDPTAITVRALEAGADGDAQDEARLFVLSDTISRRDLPTRLWLIQHAVDRGDVAGALHHFDLALRTSTDAPAALFPVLAGATADPHMAVPLARLLDRQSDWRAAFFHYATVRAGSVIGLARVVAQMRDRAWLTTNGLADAFIVRLVADGEFTAAHQIYDLLHGRADPATLVHDDQFADPHAVFPFGWLLVQKGEIGSERNVVGGRFALGYQALSGGNGAVANQLLTLSPGRYRFVVRAAITATDPQSPPYWTLTCAGKRSDQIALFDAPVARDATVAAIVTVPAGCTVQWLVLTLRASDQPNGQSGALASVKLARL